MIQLPKILKTAVVDCGSCTLCCYGQTIFMMPDQGDDFTKYKTVPAYDPIFGRHTHKLQVQPDGACIHLVDGKCEVYEQRPATCRVFDCGATYAMLPRAERRRRVKAGVSEQAIYDRGREVHEARTKR